MVSRQIPYVTKEPNGGGGETRARHTFPSEPVSFYRRKDHELAVPRRPWYNMPCAQQSQPEVARPLEYVVRPLVRKCGRKAGKYPRRRGPCPHSGPEGANARKEGQPSAQWPRVGKKRAHVEEGDGRRPSQLANHCISYRLTWKTFGALDRRKPCSCRTSAPSPSPGP